MNTTILRYKLQQIYYRLGGSAEMLGTILSKPLPTTTKNGDFLRVMFNGHSRYLTIYMRPELYFQKKALFDSYNPVLIEGAIYDYYAIAWDVRQA